jgi:hypothetical protein
MKTYYYLAIQWEKGDRYMPEFGDYDLECVEDERDYYLESSYDLKPKQIKIIKSDGTQSSLDQAIAKLNATLKGLK